MHVLATDETNLTAGDQRRFFIYGGLVLPADVLPDLHVAIERIRLEHALRPGEPLKFDTRARPEHVSIESYTEAKSKVLGACVDLGVHFIAYLVLHAIARNQERDFLVESGVNTVLQIFNNKYLDEVASHGLVVVDRLPVNRDYDYLKDKFGIGLTGDGWEQRLGRICLFSSTCDGASHLSSAVDIVLGSFRFCVNADDIDHPAVRAIFPQVARLLWHKRVGGSLYVREYGLALRPTEVRVPAYQQQYDDLVARFNALTPED